MNEILVCQAELKKLNINVIFFFIELSDEINSNQYLI